MLSCDRSSARNVGLPANNPQEQRKTCNQVQMGDTVGKSLQDKSTYMPAVFESRDLSYRIKACRASDFASSERFAFRDLC